MLRSRWFGIVQDYSQRDMKYGKDKLIALSGLAHDYAEREKRGKYAAGLWLVDMPSALLWRTRQQSHDPPHRPSEYRAPSWSWASIDGPITYDSQKLETETQYGGIWLPDDSHPPRDSSEYDFGAFRVREVQTTTSSLDHMGAVSAGYITLTGLVTRATITSDDLHTKHNLLRDPNGWVVGALFADVQTEVEPYKDIYCISIRDEQDGAQVDMPKELEVVNYRPVGDQFERSEMVMGLGLVRIGGENDGKGFRRLGLVRWIRKDFFVGKGVTTIKVF